MTSTDEFTIRNGCFHVTFSQEMIICRLVEWKYDQIRISLRGSPTISTLSTAQSPEKGESLTFDWGKRGKPQRSNDFPTAIHNFHEIFVLKGNGCVMWHRWRFPPWPLWRTCLSSFATAATNVTRFSRVQVSLWRKWWRVIYVWHDWFLQVSVIRF